MQRDRIKTLAVLSLASLGLLLSSCSTEHINYPSNASDQIIEGLEGENPYNLYEMYYDYLNSGTTLQAKTLDNILIQMAEDKMADDATWITEEWLNDEVEERLVDAVTSGSYDKDHKFMESQYVASLTRNLYNITCPATGANDGNYVITPDSTYEDIFFCNYDDYKEKYLIPEIYKQKLVSQYIYDESYSSIGSSNARDVKIVAITDRADKPGMARKLINDYIKNNIDVEASVTLQDLDYIAKLWKGVDLTDDEKSYLSNLGVETLNDRIAEDVSKIDFDDKQLTDSSLESQYTGNYTYSVAKGRELAEDSLRKQDMITEGYYLKSDGLSNLPSDLKSRIFSSNYNIDPSATRRDVTVTKPNGKRYLTNVTSDSSNDDIVYYDSSSRTYYIVEIRDVITPSALERRDSDDDATKASKLERAMEVAFELAPTSSFTRNATIHYLENADIDWHDEDFYNYILNNYPDVFEDDDD